MAYKRLYIEPHSEERRSERVVRVSRSHRSVVDDRSYQLIHNIPGSYTDEQILNVLRKADRPFIQTRRVVDELGCSQRTAQKRLNQLEGESRVRSEEFGQGKLWWLDESEPDEPVEEAGAKYFRLSMTLDGYATNMLYTWLGQFGMSGFLLLVYLTARAQAVTVPVFGVGGIAYTAFAIATAGGIGVGVWGCLRGINSFLRTALKREWIGTVGV